MIPFFTLYGEKEKSAFPDILHCESIASRSSKHNWTISPHRHLSLQQFFWIETGGGTMTVDGELFVLSENQALMIPARSVHGFDFQKNTSGLVVTIPEIHWKAGLQHAQEVQQQLSHPLQVTARDELAYLFQKIAQEHKDLQFGRDQALLSLSNLLSIEISRSADLTKIQAPKKADKRSTKTGDFLELLEAHFRSEKKVGFYAQKLNITSAHLSRLCREVMSKSTSDIIQERQLLEAQRALVYTRMSVADIAFDLGFTDPAHFSKFFKGKAGVTPRQFREEADRGD